MHRRVLIGAALVLSLFLVFTGLALEKAFRDAALAGREERMAALAYLMMATAEVDENGRLSMPPNLAEPRLMLPGNGLYAQIQAPGQVWQSHSAIGVTVPFASSLPRGQRLFERYSVDGRDYFTLGVGVSWPAGAKQIKLTFSITEDSRDFDAQLATYRRTLWSWLAASAVVLLILQSTLLRWGLSPLRKVAQALTRIERGEDEQVHGDYPKELARLTENLNTLLERERAQQKRYRNALADLAHSLKTPLAVLRGTPPDAPEYAATVSEQASRMEQLVGYQLQRAATAGDGPMAVAKPLLPTVERLVSTLNKVHRDKGPQFAVTIPPDLKLRLDEGDALELFGNLLDNAAKWCEKAVRVIAKRGADGITVTIEDDGPGVSDPDAILQRGVRADEAVPGHGIGLAIVSDIVAAYQGTLTVDRSPALKGARFTLRFARL